MVPGTYLVYKPADPLAKPHHTQITHTHTRHGERNPPRLELVFCCRARADLFGRLGHYALQPAVERQPAPPPEPARLLELGEIWGGVGDMGDMGDMGRYGEIWAGEPGRAWVPW